MFRIAWLYLSWMSGARNSAQASAENLAGWCLLNKPTFRLSSTAAGDRFIGFRCWKKAVAKCLRSARVDEEAGGTGGKAVFDNRFAVKTIRTDNVRLNTGELPRYVICREGLAGGGFGGAILLALLLPWLAAWCFFSKRRSNIALLFEEIVEADALLNACRQRKITSLFFFSPFEKDANALYLLLAKENIRVNKIPSPNLIAIHNTVLLSDALTLTSPYQQDELPVYEGTIRVEEILRWLPEQYFGYGSRYDVWTEPPAGTIGFYSHASWVRQQEDHIDAGIGDHEAEASLLPALAKFLANNGGFRLIIFLHPREKKYPDFSRVEAFYAGIFGNLPYTFAEKSTPGTQLFDTVDIGVGAISTILFERLFLGFKTVFYPHGMPLFPVKGSRIEKICATGPEELAETIREAAALPAAEYFRTTGLDRYTKEKWLQKQTEFPSDQPHRPAPGST